MGERFKRAFDTLHHSMEIPLDSPARVRPPGVATAEQDRHFRTDHLLGDLRTRAVSGTLVATAAQASKFALNLISAVVLARLLMPEDFGLVAMVTAITGFLLIFKDAGLSTATIQKAEITHAQVSNLFWVNLGVSGALSLVVAALAPVVAWFYRDPRLVAVTLALASTFAVSGAVVQHQALLNRQLRFKAVALIEISSAIIGLVVAVTMACLGFKYWSLVGMQLSMSFAELILTLLISRWRPQRPTRGTGTVSLLQFGASLTVASVFRRIASVSDNLLIGRWYGADAVGLYSRAAILFMRPVDQLIVPLEAVFTPILSRLQNDPARYRRTFLQVYGAVALFSFPVAGLFLALSRPLVLLLLGPKWEQAIPIFAWFTIAALYFPLYYAVMWLLNTQGRGKDVMTTSLILSITTVAAIVAGLPFGPVAVAAAFSCVGLLVRLPVQFYIVGRRGPVGTADLWKVALKYLPNWGIVFGATWLIMRILPPDCSLIVQLCICASAGTVAGIVLVLALPWQRRDVLRLWDLLKPLIVRFRTSR
jgi:PST family polysaccharide transporter